MTHEDKELLLKDLCARLPYGVKVEITHWRNRDKGIMDSKIFRVPLDVNKASVLIKSTSDIRPYLFPLSSMSEEQKKELRQMDAFISTFGNICFAMYDEYGHDIIPTYEDAIRITNWLNKNHFDYRGLIPKGIALDATGLNIY